MHEYTKELHRRGWLATELADRWGIKLRQMSYICKKPKQIHWDALKGIGRKERNNGNTDG